LHLGLLASGIGPGDEVLVPSFTFAATGNSVALTGAKPVFVDIEPGSFCMDPEAAEAAITERTAGIMPVHLYGHPARMGAIREVAEAFQILVDEDAAQGHGALDQGAPVGGLSAAGCFSFYPTKNLGALGDAGAVTTNDDAIADRLRRLRNYGEVAKYRNESLGFNSRLDELQAAILRVKLRHLDGWVEARRRIARAYDEALGPTGLVTPIERPGCRHAYHLYVTRATSREAWRARLREQGVETAVHYPTPLHLQGFQRYLGYQPGDFPEAERACLEVLSLPLYPELLAEEFDRVVAAARSASASGTVAREPRVGNA
jgi:dTDP-4-amino-4,6-dideoxygalactose transaminase